MSPDEAMAQIDTQLSHVWMVRTFLKHDEEAAEDDDLQEVRRGLYDFALALGPAWSVRDSAAYLKQARKKRAKLRAVVELFCQVQPEISAHTNFQMAAASLKAAIDRIDSILTETDA